MHNSLLFKYRLVLIITRYHEYNVILISAVDINDIIDE